MLRKNRKQPTLCTHQIIIIITITINVGFQSKWYNNITSRNPLRSFCYIHILSMIVCTIFLKMWILLCYTFWYKNEEILILDKWPNCVCKRTSSFDRPHLFYRVLLKFATLRKWRAEEEKEQQHMNLHSEACITLALTYHRQYRTFQNPYHVCRSTFVTKWFPIAQLLHIYTVEICSLYLCKL